MAPSAPELKTRSWWGALPLLVTVLTGLLLSWHSLGDLDIWFHLRSGQDLLDGQGVSQVNKYSFTQPEHPWVNHEWLFQVLAAATGPESVSETLEPDVSGWNILRTSLALLLLLTVLAGDGGKNRFLGREGASAASWAAVPILAALLLLWPRLTLRPELFSYVFFVLLIRWSETFFRLSPEEGPLDSGKTQTSANIWSELVDPRRLGGRLFLLTLLWAQLHGFASLAPMMVLVAAALAPVQNRLYRKHISSLTPKPRTAKQSGLLLALLILALVMTPNGMDGLMMPVRAVSQFFQDKADLRTTISELVPLQKSPNSLGLTISVYRISLVWGIVWIVATAGRVSLLRIVLFFLAALGAYTNQRSIGFYALSFMLLHTGAGNRPWPLTLPGRWPKAPPFLCPAAGWILCLLAAGLFWPSLVGDGFYLHEGVSRRFGSGLTPAHYPVLSARNLAQIEDPRYFANLDAAGFLLANSSGRGYIDGRTEAYSADLWAEYLDIRQGDERALNILAQRGVQAVCLATSSSSFNDLALKLLDSPQWSLATAEPGGLLFYPRSSGIDQTDKYILTQAGDRNLAHLGERSATRKADLCLASGNLFMFAGEIAKQEAAYRQGLSLQPDHPTLNHNLGNILLDRQGFAEALPHFQSALQTNPRLAGSAVNLGVCQMRTGQVSEAVASFKKAVGIDPARFEGWVNLALAQYRTGDNPGAIRNLEKALKIRPGDPRLRQLLSEWKNGTRK